MPEINLGKVVGPPGPAGPQGIQGPVGPQGVPGEGFPVGGETGEVLVKASDVDYDITWTKPSDIWTASNLNLLENWYFPDPINQCGYTIFRGENAPSTNPDSNTKYGNINDYTIDRWKALLRDDGLMEITSSGIKLSVNTKKSIYFYLKIDNKQNFIGKTFTFSVLVDAAENTETNVWFANSSLQARKFTGINNSGVQLISVTGVLEVDYDNVGIYINSPTSSPFNSTIIAAKLELGSVQTLAHQDTDGNWVLNDPPPNKALELAKCQRYYQKISYKPRVFCYYDGIISGFLFINPMRAIPTVSFTVGDPYGILHNVISKEVSSDGVNYIRIENASIGTFYAVYDIICDANL